MFSGKKHLYIIIGSFVVGIAAVLIVYFAMISTGLIQTTKNHLIITTGDAEKAYDGTPFMVKIKSDGGLKKALRLVVALAERLGTELDEEFKEVDYIAMYPTATDEEMLEEGLIKATKEKKVALDF